MLIDNNNDTDNMTNMINRNQTLNVSNTRITYPNSSVNSAKSNIAGITNMPAIEDRFKNLKIDKSPAKQIMNSAGQNIIQNKIRGIDDYSVK